MVLGRGRALLAAGAEASWGSSPWSCHVSISLPLIFLEVFLEMRMWRTFWCGVQAGVAKIKQIHGKPQQTERSFHTQSFRSCSALPSLAVHVGCLYFVTHIIRKLIADLEAYRISQHSQIVSLRNMKIKEMCTELLLKGQHGSQSLPHEVFVLFFLTLTLL